MPNDLKDSIQFVLKEQPNLTVKQAAKALNQKEDTVYRNLKRLEKDRLVRAIPKPNPDAPGKIDFWRLTSDTRAPLKGNLKHEMTANEIYAALFGSGLEMTWEAVPDLGAGFFPDRGFTAYGKQFYIENHTGTQTVEKVVPEKLERYIRYGVEQQVRFHVLFIVHDYPRSVPKPSMMKAEDTADKILEIIAGHNRGNQFTVGLFKYFSTKPLIENFVSPHSETILSLATI